MIPTHGSSQRMYKSIQEEYKIWILAAEAYDYVVQFRPYQGAKKGKHVASTTKWGLGENVILWLMECLTLTFSFDIFMKNFFTSFRLLPTLELTTFEQQGALKKNRLRKCTITGDKQLQKTGKWPLCTEHIKHKNSIT